MTASSATGAAHVHLRARMVALVNGRPGKPERIALLAVYAVFICLRMPNVLNGRFWAEEGNVFFFKAWTLPWQEALFAPHGGYWNVVAVSAGLLARYFANMQSAPYVTTGIALLFQLCPAIVILTSRTGWLQRRAVLVAALLLIAAAPVAEEVWLNSLHSQFHLALCAALILAFEPATGKVEVFRRVLLFLGPVSGPGSAVFAPLFALRAMIDRSYRRAVQACVLGIATAIQLAVFYSPDPGRVHDFRLWQLLSAIFVRHVWMPLLGRSQALFLSSKLQAGFWDGKIVLWAPLLAVAVFCVFALALLLRRRADLIWLFVAGSCFAVVAYCGALADLVTLINAEAGMRYHYVPQTIFALVILGLAATGHDFIAKCAWVLTVWLVVIGVDEYFSPGASTATGPDWHSEVKAWHKNPDRALNIWPQGWVVHLPRRDHLP